MRAAQQPGHRRVPRCGHPAGVWERNKYKKSQLQQYAAVCSSRVADAPGPLSSSQGTAQRLIAASLWVIGRGNRASFMTQQYAASSGRFLSRSNGRNTFPTPRRTRAAGVLWESACTCHKHYAVVVSGTQTSRKTHLVQHLLSVHAAQDVYTAAPQALHTTTTQLAQPQPC